MALSNVDRARVILDLLKDGRVADEAAYVSVDKISSAVGLKWASRFKESPEDSNDVAADNMIQYLRDCLKKVAEEKAKRDAASSAAYDSRAETEAEIG